MTLRGRPIHFSLKWLKPPPLPPDGNMTLFEHLRELRYRLVVASLAILVGTIIGFVFYEWLFQLLLEPYSTAIALIKEKRPDINASIVIGSVSKPFTLSLKVSLIAGLVLSGPVWLYQLWAFIVPGLLAKEKKWTLIFVGIASPLFAAGIALGYYVMPKGIAVMIGFTPAGAAITNLQDVSEFLTFLIRVMLVFGLAFEIPLFVLMLNIMGVVKAVQLSKYRSYVIFGVFVFAAVATPSVDPVSMLLLALPMTVLFILSEVIAHILDRRKARRAVDSDGELVLRGSVDDDVALQKLSESDDTQVNGNSSAKVNGAAAGDSMADAMGFKKKIDEQG
nr:twin-arginine translocase subunit TatC [Microlunatus panaciterrae]